MAAYSSPPPASTAAPATPTSQRLAAAVTRLADRRTGAFRASLEMGESRAEAAGSYDLVSRSAQIQLYMRVPGESQTIESLFVGPQAWFRLKSHEWPCWVHYAAGAPYPDLPNGGVPGAVLAALAIRSQGGHGPAAHIETDLASVAGAVSGRLPKALGIPARSDDRVQVSVDVSSRGAIHWTAPIADVAAAAVAAGRTPAQELPDDLSGAIEATVEPGPLGSRIAPPSRGEVVELTSDLESDMARCGAH